jgi:NAD(P)H dehydrogenase (quinone)
VSALNRFQLNGCTPPYSECAAGGAQGATDNRLTRLLTEKRVPVRAFVRRVDDRSDVLRELGAEIFVGDLVDIQSVRQALKGIESMYFCYPVQADLLEATAILAQAAREEDLQFIFQLSSGSSSDQSPSPWGRKAWLPEQILVWSGIPRRSRPCPSSLVQRAACAAT